MVKGLYDSIQRLVPNTDVQNKIMVELPKYKQAVGMFETPLAARTREKAPSRISFIEL